jgi:hypothetical protein
MEEGVGRQTLQESNDSSGLLDSYDEADGKVLQMVWLSLS